MKHQSKITNGPRVLGFAAFSGTGKTTLLKQLIPSLRQRGIRVAVIKHAHHDFDIDYPGKDSYELRKSGADQVIVASGYRWAMVTERRCEPELPFLLSKLETQEVDLVLVEGFKHLAFSKLELHRSPLDKPLLFQNDPDIVAIACDGGTRLPDSATLPRLDIDQVESVTDFIVQWLKATTV